MKFKLNGVVFSLLFALGLVFSFSIEAVGSHGDGQGVEAEDVDPGNQGQMEMFLDHIAGYHNQVNTESLGGDVNSRARAVTRFARDVRRSETYHHEDVYSIIINSQTNLVVNHAKYPELLGYGFNPDAQNSDVAGALKALLDNSGLGGMPHCERYGQNDERVACATRIDTLIGQSTIVVGLHHTEDDGLFRPPDCPGFGFELETSAEEVYSNPTEANLQAYVQGVIGVTQKGMQDITTGVINDDPAEFQQLLTLFVTDPSAPETNAAAAAFQAKLNGRFSQRFACYGGGDFKHGNIYLFIMSTDPAGTVLLNGNNFDLNGLNLEADDNELPGDDKSIAGLFRNALTGGSGEPQAGQSATVNYRWDDPDDPDDTIPGWFEMGLVPGSSPKTSYIEVGDLFEGYTVGGFPIPPQLLIFGSGIYPEEDDGGDDMVTDDDDGACAIAGTSNTFQGALLNLFLIASVLFSVVFLRKRA